MRKNLLFLGVILFINVANAQQMPEYSQWFLHQMVNNPAHAGIKQCIDIRALYRAQWLDFDGSPNSGALTLSIPLQAKRSRLLSARHGTGFRFETDQIGNFSTNRVNFAYAAHFNFNQYDRLSLGVFGGVLQTGYDPANATTAVPDPEVMQQSSFISPDASFGAWFNSKNYYVGLVMESLFPTRWQDIGNDSRYGIHFMLNGGYRMAINEMFTFLPQANLRFAPQSTVAFDLNAYFDYNNVLGFGLGYRAGDAINAVIAVKIKSQFMIAYSYDYTLTDIQKVAKNTHELSLRFTTCKGKRSGTTKCPLFE